MGGSLVSVAQTANCKLQLLRFSFAVALSQFGSLDFVVGSTIACSKVVVPTIPRKLWSCRGNEDQKLLRRIITCKPTHTVESCEAQPFVKKKDSVSRLCRQEHVGRKSNYIQFSKFLFLFLLFTTKCPSVSCPNL